MTRTPRIPIKPLVLLLAVGGMVLGLWLATRSGSGDGTNPAEVREKMEVPRMVARRLAPPPGEKPTAVDVAGETTGILVPEVVAEFDRWLERFVSVPPDRRAALLERGRQLLGPRRKAVAALIATDPEAAILATPSPAMRALLPPDFLEQMETIVATEGFYGVKAICDHGAESTHSSACRIEHEVIVGGETIPVSIYGSRKERLTEEDASLYGVVLDGRMALHEDDVVIRPASEMEGSSATTGQWALIYKGKVTLVSSESEIPAEIRRIQGL